MQDRESGDVLDAEGSESIGLDKGGRRVMQVVNCFAPQAHSEDRVVDRDWEGTDGRVEVR